MSGVGAVSVGWGAASAGWGAALGALLARREGLRRPDPPWCPLDCWLRRGWLGGRGWGLWGGGPRREPRWGGPGVTPLAQGCQG